MAMRGLIVAIESYGAMREGLSPTLDGTHAGALAFRRWLVEERGVEPQHIRFCAEDEGLEGRTGGATLNEIVDQIDALVAEGQDHTEQLFVYLAGHGFCYTDVDGVRVADVLLAADYRDRQHGWRTCLSIDEVVKWLRLSLGPLDHFYFVDCCRNGIGAAEIKVAQIGPYGASDLGFPAVYMLYSTTPGQLAAVKSGFTSVLVDGLNGNGRAKDWFDGRMAVLFRTLKPYLVKAVPGQAVDGREEGNHDGLIRVIDPTPQYTCTVLVEHAAVDDQFTLELKTWPQGHQLGSREFTGPSYELREPPDAYRLSVLSNGVELTALDPLPADLFSDCTIRFAKPRARRGAGPEAAPAPAPAATQVRAPEAARVVVRRAGEPEREETGAGEFTLDLAPGTYAVEVRDRRDVTVRREELNVGAEPPAELDFARFERSPLRDALLQAIPGHHHGGAVDFSETLGPMPDQGLDLWLGVIGAARILESPQDDFSKLGPLPLASFDQTPAGACPLYLLAGLEDGAPLAAGVDGPLAPIESHQAIPGLHELVLPDLGAGVHLLGVRVGAGEPLTLPVAGLANRATLVTAWRPPRRAALRPVRAADPAPLRATPVRGPARVRAAAADRAPPGRAPAAVRRRPRAHRRDRRGRAHVAALRQVVRARLHPVRRVRARSSRQGRAAARGGHQLPQLLRGVPRRRGDRPARRHGVVDARPAPAGPRRPARARPPAEPAAAAAGGPPLRGSLDALARRAGEPLTPRLRWLRRARSTARRGCAPPRDGDLSSAAAAR